MTEVIVHQVPTFFVEYRGWSQEVNIHHCEYTEPGKRFEARGRHTPFDKVGSLSTFGNCADEAICKFEFTIASAPYDVHYKSINDELLYLRSEVERLSPKPVEETKVTP